MSVRDSSDEQISVSARLLMTIISVENKFEKECRQISTKQRVCVVQCIL